MDAALPPAAPRSSPRNKVIAGFVILALIAVVVWLLMRGCEKPPAVERGFDYFHAKAEELGRDPEKVKAFVASEIKTLGYSGNAKGPLATLWNGAGSKDEKAQLEEVLLACCDADVDSKEAWAKSAGFKSGEQVEITIAVESAQGQARSLTEKKLERVQSGLLAGGVHSVEIVEGPKLRLTLRRYDGGHVLELDLANADACTLTFVFVRDGKESRRVVRELWHKDNRTGPTFPIVGDRHDFIVLPARMSKYVREKEELRLKEAKRENDDASKAYLALLDYCLESDKLLAGLEKQNKVTAAFDTPRIVVLSRYNLPAFVGGPAHALDLRLNYTSFEGERVIAYSSVQTRSMVEAALETHWLQKYLKKPCTSAHDIITSLAESYPNTPARRLQAVLDALSGSAGEPPGAQLIFSALDPAAPKDAKPPEIVLTRLKGGKWAIKSGPLNQAILDDFAKNKDMPRLPIKAGCVEGITNSPERIAYLIETAMMAAEVKPRVSPRYVLLARLAGARSSLVADGASFTFAWGQGEDRVDQQILVSALSDELTLQTRVQSGIRPVKGTRTIRAEALENATLHNPWYSQGSDVQPDATSFVVSRKVFAALKAGKASEFALAGKYEFMEDAKEGKPRPIDWRGEIVPLGAGQVKVRVNNKEETLSVLRCKAGDLEVAILDDAHWPVGMADRLLEVHTTIRARLVDENGAGVGGATINVGQAALVAGFDGSFALPPRPAGYAKVKASVAFEGETLGEPELDLTAPGLGEVLVKVRRPLKELVFIHPSERKKLDGLEVSAQVKRHANRSLDANRCVVIPNRMLKVAGQEQIAYYSFDPATGENIGVMESGLHGAADVPEDAWYEAAKNIAKEAWEARDEIAEGGLPPIHMLRGAICAWWVYASYRVEGDSHKEAIIRMIKEIDAWEAATNMFNQVEQAVGGRAGEEARSRLGGLIGGNMDGGAAVVAFKIGYLGSAYFLATYMEEAGND